MSVTLFMETTRIAPERTVQEIQSVLARYGAGAVLLDYTAGQVAAVSFKYMVADREIAFRLPCRWENLAQVLKDSGRRPRSDDTLEAWARRVAWRQILRWVEAQFAMVETGMVKVQEVFLPYAQTKGGATVFESLEKTHFKMLAYDAHE